MSPVNPWPFMWMGSNLLTSCSLPSQVHECVEKGGKVLIPVFALGRAQELCILLESYWERTNLKVPVYFSLGLTEKVGADIT